MNPIRVIVIDDSAFMRKMISDILEKNERITVIATARNGEDGLKKIQRLKPDVVTLDVEMPKMDGLTALKEIMNSSPVPVVMLSSVTKEGTDKTVQAISNGAVDFITKPSGAISLDIKSVENEIISKVVAASQVSVRNNTNTPVRPDINQIKGNHKKTLIAIGSSTGGPRALQKVLIDLSDSSVPPILIVQHMPAGFTKSLAERLNTLTKLHVKEATHGEIIQNQTVYIAPGGSHMKIRNVGTSFAIELTKEPAKYLHMPAIDVLFESIAQQQRINKIAIVLTGMGSDGAKGITYLKEQDPHTTIIAESEDSAVVYGMPKAAVKTNHVNYIVHLQQIGETIKKLIKSLGEM